MDEERHPADGVARDAAPRGDVSAFALRVVRGPLGPLRRLTPRRALGRRPPAPTPPGLPNRRARTTACRDRSQAQTTRPPAAMTTRSSLPQPANRRTTSAGTLAARAIGSAGTRRQHGGASALGARVPRGSSGQALPQADSGDDDEQLAHGRPRQERGSRHGVYFLYMEYTFVQPEGRNRTSAPVWPDPWSPHAPLQNPSLVDWNHGREQSHPRSTQPARAVGGC